MMKLKYIIPMVAAVWMGVSCDDKLESFEMQGYEGIPAPVEGMTSEALPGQIQLNWTVPEVAEYAYIKIWYEDPLQKETIYKIVSPGTTEMLIDDTRARFGEYEIFYQTFNIHDEGGEIKSIKAVSGAAPATYTLRKCNVTVDMLSTNAQEPTEGPIANLVDGNKGSFFHTRWNEPLIPLPHYVQIDFAEPHGDFVVSYVNRSDNTWTTDGRPTEVELQISNDGEKWETITTLTGLPTSAGSEYTSDYIMPGKTFTYFRFNVIATSGNTSYFNMAELTMSDLEVYDPETVPLE